MKNNKITHEASDKLLDYFDSLQLTNVDLNTLVDCEKIYDSVEKIKTKINQLNYLICDNITELDKRIASLFNKDPNCFKLLCNLLAVDEKKMVIVDDQIKSIKELLQSLDGIKRIIYDTKLSVLLTNGSLTNLLPFLYGVKLGTDTNTRKNRAGSNNENSLLNLITEHYKNNENIVIQEQVQSEEFTFLNRRELKKYDYVVTNLKNNHKVLIEASFYNAGGSKVTETCRSYMEIYDRLKASNKTNIHFLWVADGYGMTTIKGTLKDCIDYGYIVSRKQFLPTLDRLLQIEKD